MNSNRSKIGFLFGSGLSIPAGLPSTTEITDHVLSGTGISRHSNSTYFIGPPLYGMPDQYVPTVLKFLARLKSEVDSYYSFNPSRTTTYEDLFSIASQINDSESGQYDNPALGQLIRQILTDSQDILRGKPHLPEATWRLIDITSEVTSYIRDVVWAKLSIKAGDLSYLTFIKDAFADDSVQTNLIVTLNHDTVLETLLNQLHVTVVDGFEEPTSQRRIWNPRLLENVDNPALMLLKLHGSINWFFFEKDNTYTLAVPLADFWKMHPTEYPLHGRPEILVGTINKILQYSNPIYVDLQCCFHRLLTQQNVLVVIGYGFGDKAINTRIINWLGSTSSKRMVVVHPNPDQLVKQARTAIKSNWPRWVETRQVVAIPKIVQDVTWKEIAQNVEIFSGANVG